MDSTLFSFLCYCGCSGSRSEYADLNLAILQRPDQYLLFEWIFGEGLGLRPGREEQNVLVRCMASKRTRWEDHGACIISGVENVTPIYIYIYISF